MGSIYKRGQTYWIKYYHEGKPVYESSKSKLKMIAKELLKQREGDISRGKMPGVYFDKVTFEDLEKDLFADYRMKKNKSFDRLHLSSGHLKRYVEGYKAHKINSIEINAYMEMRIKEGAASATINRELAALKRMLNIGASMTPPKVNRVPHIEMLKENNIRTGFFEHDEFIKLHEHLPECLKGFVMFAYKTGWRLREISGLTWNHIDRQHGKVRLNPEDTKTDEGRVYYLDNELKAVINKQRELRLKNKGSCDYVFSNRLGTGRIVDIRKSWNLAFEKAEIKRKLFHDLRQTAVRNMVRSGIPERVAMKISGHKTRSVFDRYNIVSDTDLKLAAQRLEQYLNHKM